MTDLANIQFISSSVDGDLFWAKMGKFFASKEIRKEFHGYPLNDSDQHIWFVYFNAEKEVLSFLGLSLEKIKNNIALITEMYTVKEHRQQGLSAMLFEKALQYASKIESVNSIEVCVNPKSHVHNLARNHQFKVEYMRGAYTYYSKNL